MNLSLRLAAALLFTASALAQTRPAITGIAFTRVYSASPAASEAFYRMLGYQPLPAGAMTRYPISDSQWIEVEKLPDPVPPARLAAVGFTTRNAKALAAYLQARGVTIDQPLHDGEFGVLDPEGNRVVFVQAGLLKLPPAQKTAFAKAPSHRMIHAGHAVSSAQAEDRFYREILGFRPYWHGGMTDTKVDFQSLQVPDGSDWIEYMLDQVRPGDLKQIGSMDHFSLGLAHMQSAVDALAASGCASTSQAANCKRFRTGRDGKVQLNVFDPDLTRVEYMEFEPSGPICCSALVGRHPREVENH